MSIDKKVLEKVMGPIVANDQNQGIEVSLFVVSKNKPGLKQLNLHNLSSEERTKKLQKWAQDNRFVAVIKKGDDIFAHAHAQTAEKLQKQDDLTIDGKKVAIKTLTDEEAAKLSTEVFEEFARESTEKVEERKSEKEREHDHTTAPGYVIRQYLAFKSLVNDQTYAGYVIAKMQSMPGQIMLNCLRRLEEARREEQKQKEADDKYFEIKHREIEKQIKKQAIIQEDIKVQGKKREAVAEDVEHVVHVRGD
jgi:hypothetical protein